MTFGKITAMTRMLMLIIAATSVMQDAHSAEDQQSVKTLIWRGLDNGTVLRGFDARFKAMDSLLNNAVSVTLPPVLYDDAGTDILEADSLYAEKTRQEQAAFKRRNGLEITGQAYQRLDNSFGFDEEEDRYSTYTTKIQAELGWNIFNSAILQRGSELRRIDLANRLDNLRRRRALMPDIWITLRRQVTDTYGLLTATVMAHRLDNLDLLNMAYQYTLEQDRVNNEKLLDVMNDKMDIEYQLLQLAPADSARLRPLTLLNPMQIIVDRDAITEAISHSSDNMREHLLADSLLATRARLTNYAHSMRFTPFVRASHYLRLNGGSPSTNIDAGVRFTFPLYDDAAKTRRAIKAERDIAAVTTENAAATATERCGILMQRIDRLNATIATEQSHLRQMTQFINMRREAYAHSSGGYNYITRLEEYNEYLKSLERMYRLMMTRDLALIDLQETSGCTPRAITMNPITQQ